jgi:hypothetical protein
MGRSPNYSRPKYEQVKTSPVPKKPKKFKLTDEKEIEIKSPESIPAPFRIKSPEYLSARIKQMLFDRESLVNQMLSYREMVATCEMEIALTVCPWRLGDIVNYNKLDGVSEVTKAMVVEIKFSPMEPFYEIYIQEFFQNNPSSTLLKLRRKVKNISHIMGATGIETEDDGKYAQKLFRLIQLGVIKLPKYVPVDDEGLFIRRIISSINRGKNLSQLSPVAVKFLQEALKIGK